MNAVVNRNNVKVMGQGEKTIVFAHGFGCDQSMWSYIAPAFEKNIELFCLIMLVGEIPI